MEHGFMTDRGQIRELNEDSLMYREYPKYTLVTVADGMGGHNAGEVASRKAVKGFEGAVSGLDKISEDTKKKLLYCVSEVNGEIYHTAITTRGLIGMGTTLTAAVIIGNRAHIINVGDSRAYIIKSGDIRQITVDHSYVEELRLSGRITEEEARVHPERNQITRAVGTEDTVSADYFEVELDEGDILFLCSDGLTNMLYDGEIKEVFETVGDLQDACMELINKANARGGYDNITVASVRFGAEDK